MDKKDEKILKELLLNSRESTNKLAKKVNISREVANYRINKLKYTFIKDFTTLIDFKKLGYKKYGCFIQFKGISLEQEEIIIKYLINHNSIMYLSPIIGKWNVAFDILAKNEKELKDITNDITEKCKKYLDKFILTGTGMHEENFPTKFVGEEYKLTKLKKQKKQKEYTIDEMDKKIIKILSNDSRISYVELAKKLNLTPNSIKYRIKNLEKSKIILGYTISIDFKKLGYEVYNLQLKLDILENKKLYSFLRQHPKVIYYYNYLGHENWDLDIGLIISNSLELRKFIIDIRKNFGEIIKLYDIYILTEIFKNYYPKNIFK
ncbi:Lrp/AsnC family transcriptional regulator [Candidatus Micrarchaeota archaeon]|nr:Lrp/AsnC family transcriptional regulator [Candidatus Micrarchaeota archaeon]